MLQKRSRDGSGPIRQLGGAIAFWLVVTLAGCSTLLVDSYRYGRIEIKALLESGEPAGGILLALYSGERHFAYGTTNSAGEFTFEHVPFGWYGVYAQLHPEYETMDLEPSDYRHDLNLWDGGTVSLVFSGLRKLGPPPDEPMGTSGDTF